MFYKEYLVDFWEVIKSYWTITSNWLNEHQRIIAYFGLVLALFTFISTLIGLFFAYRAIIVPIEEAKKEEKEEKIKSYKVIDNILMHDYINILELLELLELLEFYAKYFTYEIEQSGAPASIPDQNLGLLTNVSLLKNLDHKEIQNIL